MNVEIPPIIPMISNARKAIDSDTATVNLRREKQIHRI